jgi:hypothetical protein
MSIEREPARVSFERLCQRISKEQYMGRYAPTRADYDTFRSYAWKSATSMYTESAWQARMYILLGLEVAPVHRMSEAMLERIAETEEEMKAELPEGMPCILRGVTIRSDGVIEERYELR